MFAISDENLQALVELYVDEGLTFGHVAKEVREELEGKNNYCSVPDAIKATRHGLELASKRGHKACRMMLEQCR
jgi:hypothetical protein